jgi:hypothetical protein
MDEFERELRQAFARQPAPPGLKNRIMQRRRTASSRRSFPFFAWNGLAASFVSVSLCILAALAIYGGYEQRQAEQRRKAEDVRQQVLIALRITNRALNHMNHQLAAHGRARQESGDN